MQQFGFSDLSPQPLEMCFFDWWNRAAALVTAPLKKGLNSPIILGAWTICDIATIVFNGAQPHLSTTLNMARNDAWSWSLRLGPTG
jgi:hypothetical protein